MRRLALALGSLAFTTLAAAPALADCVPGTPFCASVGVGVAPVQVGGQIQVGVPAAPTAPPPVYVYQEAPPPPAYYAPYAPRPRYAYAQPYWGVGKVGLDVHIDGAMGFNSNVGEGVYGSGGAGLGLRYHALPHLGLELGVDFLGGRDWESRKTTTVAGNLGGLIYFNPRSRAQLYLSGGLLVDHTSASPQGNFDQFGGNTFASAPDIAYTHVGGYGGLGLEIFATRRLAFHLDARGIVRQNVTGGAPEFTDPNTGHTTNTSGGLVTQAGLTFYF